MNERNLGINARITKWHVEEIDGKQIRVIDEWEILGVSIVPDREYLHLFTWEVQTEESI